MSVSRPVVSDPTPLPRSPLARRLALSHAPIKLVPVDQYQPTAKPAPKPAPATPPTPGVVPGENIRTGISIAATVLGPIATARQAIDHLAPMVEHVAVLGPLARASERALAFAESVPWAAATLHGIGRLVPYLGAGILVFDGYAAFQTFHDATASHKRKLLVGLRFATNFVATVLGFIPGWGLLASTAPSLANGVFDVWVKIMNAKHEA